MLSSVKRLMSGRNAAGERRACGYRASARVIRSSSFACLSTGAPPLRGSQARGISTGEI
jgi:hypothetical protein